jgi:DNA-binding MarR family transcriptional regulator
MNTTPKPISDTISFVLARVGVAHRFRASRMLTEVGLHVGQEMLLQILWQEDKLTQTELADRLCIQLATVNKMIQRMERAGWVTKCGDEQDGRVSRVQLTQKGSDLQAATEQVWDRLEQCTLANFTPEERGILGRFLHQLYENLSQED